MSTYPSIYHLPTHLQPPRQGHLSTYPPIYPPTYRPPAKAFPVIWISIGVLRTIASSLIYETTGTLLCEPLYALFLHLSIGDTWNTIANKEDRTGAAVPGTYLLTSPFLLSCLP